MWTEQSVEKFWQHSETSFVADTTASEIFRLSKKHIKGRTLDVGAGSGALIDKISGAVGVDIAPHHPLVIEGSVAALPFEDVTFSTVFLTDVIEHLPDDVLRKGMKEIYRVMKFGGKLIIVAPYRENLKESFVLCPDCGASFHRVGHLRTIDEAWMFNLLNTNGFNVVEARLAPLALMAKHWSIRYLWPVAVRMGLISVRDMYVVAEKV